MLDQCFICGHFKFGTDVQGFHVCNTCYKNGGELVITSEYGEGMGVMEAAYLEIQCQTTSTS
jgi:hypothetical protein